MSAVMLCVLLTAGSLWSLHYSTALLHLTRFITQVGLILSVRQDLESDSLWSVLTLTASEYWSLLRLCPGTCAVHFVLGPQWLMLPVIWVNWESIFVWMTFSYISLSPGVTAAAGIVDCVEPCVWQRSRDLAGRTLAQANWWQNWSWWLSLITLAQTWRPALSELGYITDLPFEMKTCW